jgi:hypothetical protein
MSKIYASSLEQPKGFEGKEFYHGFNAFFTGKPYEYKFNKLKDNPHRQICTSTKYLGMMGVKVIGEVILASSYDLFSGIDIDTGERWFDSNDMDSIVYNYNDLELHEDDNEENNEIIMRNIIITAIWITSDAPMKLKALAHELAKVNNLPIIEVGKSIFS